MEKITIPAVPHKLREYIRDGDETIELFDRYLRMSGRARVSEVDEKSELPIESTYDYDIYIDRLSISSINLIYNNDTGRYQVCIIHETTLYSVVPSREVGTAILEKLRDWRWGV